MYLIWRGAGGYRWRDLQLYDVLMYSRIAFWRGFAAIGPAPAIRWSAVGRMRMRTHAHMDYMTTGAGARVDGWGNP